MGNNSILQRIEITPNAKKTSSGGTEVDELPNGWRIVKLGEVFKFTKKPKELRYSEFDKIPFIPMDLLPLGSTSFEQFILKSKDDISSGTYFESGDILIAKITPSFENGKQGIIEKLPTPFGIATTEVIPIKEIEGISDKYYLFYYLLRQDIRTELAGKMEGSTGRQRLNISTLASLELPLPPLPQQITIAKVLWTIQEAIQARRDELDLERERKADLMEYLFTRGSGGDSVSTKKTKFGSVPVSWKLMVLEQCAFVQTGVAKGRKFSDNHTINLPYLRVANVQDGYLDLTEIKYIKLRESEVERYKLQPDDVVVTEGGDFDKLGRGFLWSGQIPNCVHQNHIFAVRVNQNLLIPKYFAYLIQSNYGKAYFLSVAHRTTNLASINSTKLKAFPAIIPSLQEQKDIIVILDACDAKITTLEQEAVLLEELFQALLEDLTTGQLSILSLVEKRETHE